MRVVCSSSDRQISPTFGYGKFPSRRSARNFEGKPPPQQQSCLVKRIGPQYWLVGIVLLGACGGPSLNPFADGPSDSAASGGATTVGVDPVPLPTSGSGTGGSGAPIGASGGDVGSSGGTSSSSGGTDCEVPRGEGGTGGVDSNSGGTGAFGGTAGSGAIIAPQSACFGHSVPPQPLLADCEAGTEDWFAYTDGSAASVRVLHPGAATTQTAVQFDGEAAKSSGVGLALFCDDVSAYTGVSFWAKGKGGEHMRFLVAIPDTDAKPGRGDCNPVAVKCNDHPGKAFVLESEWKQYRVTWPELKQYGWGEPATFSGVANSLLWINDGPVQSFDFAVDQVRLISPDQ